MKLGAQDAASNDENHGRTHPIIPGGATLARTPRRPALASRANLAAAVPAAAAKPATSTAVAVGLSCT